MKNIYKFTCFILVALYTNSIFGQHSTKLMGVTSKGGDFNLGTIYQYDLGSQTQSVNYSNSKTRGKNAISDLTDGGNGKLYGVTLADGFSSGGVIYEVDPNSNVYSSKYILNGGSNGLDFRSKLVLYNNEFYGTAGGGSNVITFNTTSYGAGVIFKWNPNTNVYTKLADFDQTLGGLPVGNIIVYNNKMYGVTYFGGASSNGTIYEFDPATNVITKKYDFANSSLLNPSGGLIQTGGSLFGITKNGGATDQGVIYEWNPANSSFNIRNFLNSTSGYFSDGNFINYNNKLYCLTILGGALGFGTILEFDPTTYSTTKLIDFGGLNGASTVGNLLVYNNELYGAARSAGANNSGTIFKYNTTSTLLTKLHDFTGLAGSNPHSNLTTYNNKFYAATLTGGTADGGVVYSFDPSNNAFQKIEDLDGTEGSHGQGSLISYNNKFYGIDSLGGEFSKGVIYEYDIQTGIFTNLHSFDGTNGQNPNGELTIYNNKFYGTTKSGGANSIGVLYEYDVISDVFTKRFDFTLSVGSKPVGRLTEFGGKLYGCANIGGTGNRGTIFEYNTSTNLTIVKANLSFTNGGNPNSGMVLFSNNKMYGTTENGGQLAGVSGVLFEYTPGAITYTAKVNFNNATGLGNKPQNELTIYGNKVYGVTRNAGVNGNGTLYKYEPSTNTATKLLDFASATTGSKANGLFGINGKLYGTCMTGGTSALGTLFEVDTITNVLNVRRNFGGLFGETPISGNLIALVSPNYNPVFSNIPATNNGCNNINGESIFNISDADNDPLTFTLSSSNTSLIPSANLSIVNVSGSQYKLIYTPISGQTGSATVSVTANDGFGGSTIASISVTVFAAPIVTALSSAPSACVGSSITLNGSGASTYVWDNSVVNNSPFNLASTTTYTVIGTDVNGCSNTAQVSVIANALPNITITPSSTSVCAGGTLTLNSSNVLSPTWDNGVVEGQVFIPSSTLTYTVSGSNANNCSNSNSITIPVNALPAIVANASASAVCLGNPLTLNGSGGTSYTWNNGVTNNLPFNPTATATYTVTGIDANNCGNTNTVTVTVNPLPIAPVVTASLPNPVCVNTSVTLSAFNAGGTINWTGPNSFSAIGSNVVINVTANETYNVTETESVNGCTSAIGSYSIVSDPCLGIVSNTKNNFLLNISPNPAKQIVNIKTDKQIEKASIYNALGKKVWAVSGNNKSIDVSQLCHGIYTLECFIEGKSIHQKLIIE